MSCRRLLVACFFAAIVLGMCTSALRAQLLYWDPTVTNSINGGGTGTWDTGNWWSATSGSGGWVSNDTAVFGGTLGGGTVTILNGISANNLAFNTAGYTVTGSSLTFTGGTVNANANATIGSLVAGTAGLTVVGPGTLTLNGLASNVYSGNTTVTGGGLLLDFGNMSNPTNLIPSGAVTLAGGNLGVAGNPSTASSQGFSSVIASSGAISLTSTSTRPPRSTLPKGRSPSRTNSGLLDVTLPNSGAAGAAQRKHQCFNFAVLDSIFSGIS